MLHKTLWPTAAACFFVILSADAAAAKRPRPKIIYSGTRTVSLPYKLVSTPAHSVVRVEVWYKKRKGEPWKMLATDDDLTSPAEITFASDGIYVAKLVTQDISGKRLNEPVPYALIVDSVPPQVKILSPAGGAEVSPGKRVVLSWEVSDFTLKKDSVAASSSTDGGATWVLLAGKLPPKGKLDWTVPAAGVREVVFKVSASDRLGHSGEAQSPKLTVAGAAPALTAVETRPPDIKEVPEAVATIKPEGPWAGFGPLKTPHEPVQAVCGLIFRDKPNPRAALARLRTYMLDHPDSSDARYLRAHARLLTGEVDKAVQDARQVARTSPKRSEFLLLLGTAYFTRSRVSAEAGSYASELADLRLASEQFEKSLALPPELALKYCHSGMARWYLAVAEKENVEAHVTAARKNLIAALRMRPADPWVKGTSLWYLAYVFESFHEWKNAENCWRSAAVLLGRESKHYAKAVSRAEAAARAAAGGG